MTKAELQKLADKLEVELLDEPAKITFPSGVEWDDIYVIWWEEENMCVLREQGTIHKFMKAWISDEKTTYEDENVRTEEISVKELPLSCKIEIGGRTVTVK